MHPKRLVPAGLIASLILAASTSVGAASGVYLEPEQFIAEAFGDSEANSKALWISGALREKTVDILGHQPTSARLRYWYSGVRSAWILNEVGKEKPITAGFVVEDGRIVSAQVLRFRESRGWEIRNQSFTRQFDGAALIDQKLDRHIDGITGATLSVRAMRKMAQLALIYHAVVLPTGKHDQS